MTATQTNVLPILSPCPKYKAVSEVMRQRIIVGQYAVGQRLPSVIELGQEFCTSPGTVHKGLEILTREKMLACVSPKTGTIVMRAKPIATALATKPTTLACLLRPLRLRDDVDNVGLDFIEGMRQEISTAGYRFFHHSLDEENYAQRIIELAEEGSISGLILDQYTPDKEVKKLSQLGLPVTIYNRLVQMKNVSAVCPDYERVGRQSFEKLFERGYKRIVFYMSEFMQHDFQKTGQITDPMWRGFEAAAKNRLFPVEQIKEVKQNPPVANLRDLLGIEPSNANKKISVGIFCSYDLQAIQIMEAAFDASLQLGKEVGVIGCLDLLLNRKSSHPVSSWKMDRHAVGSESVRDLIARIDNPDLPRSIVKLPMDFVDRSTI